MAISHDNKIAYGDNRPAKITGDACQQFTHQQRQQADALLTTAQTIIADNPQCNVRLAGITQAKTVCVIDSMLRTPVHSTLFHTAKHIIFFHLAGVKKPSHFNHAKITCIALPGALAHPQHIDLVQLHRMLAKLGLQRIWTEVGARCFHALTQQKLFQAVFFYRGRINLGDHALPAFANPSPWSTLLNTSTWQNLGQDQLLHLTVDNIPPALYSSD